MGANGNCLSFFTVTLCFAEAVLGDMTVHSFIVSEEEREKITPARTIAAEK